MFKKAQFSQTSKVVFSLFLLFLYALSGAAQEGTGTLRGAIFDPGGAVIPGALHKIFNSRLLTRFQKEAEMSAEVLLVPERR